MAGFDSPSLVVGWTSSSIASEGEPPPHSSHSMPFLPCQPLGNMLTAALAGPHRSLNRRRHRRRRPRLDSPRSWGRCCRRCRRHQPLRGRKRLSDRGWCACAVRVHVCRTYACTLPLTDFSKLIITTATLRPALRPYRPWPVCTRLRHSRRRTGCACAAAAHRERCCPGAGHALTAHS